MRDVVIEEVGGARISFIGVFLMIIGGLLILVWLGLFLVMGALAFFCPVAIIALVLAVAYVYAGYGLLRRQDWALTWTPALMGIMIVIMLGVAGLTGGLLILAIFMPMTVIHVLILAVVMLERRKPMPEPSKPREKPVEAGRVEGLRCRNCGSENVDVYPDHSGYCADCKAAYLDVRKTP